MPAKPPRDAETCKRLLESRAILGTHGHRRATAATTPVTCRSSIRRARDGAHLLKLG